MEPMSPKESIDSMEPKGSMESMDSMASRYVKMSRHSWLEDHNPLWATQATTGYSGLGGPGSLAWPLPRNPSLPWNPWVPWSQWLTRDSLGSWDQDSRSRALDPESWIQEPILWILDRGSSWRCGVGSRIGVRQLDDEEGWGRWAMVVVSRRRSLAWVGSASPLGKRLHRFARWRLRTWWSG